MRDPTLPVRIERLTRQANDERMALPAKCTQRGGCRCTTCSYELSIGMVPQGERTERFLLAWAVKASQRQPAVP